MGPGVALLVGLLAGIVSVIGYDYSSSYLEEKFGIYDTCGVGNLHGYPSVLGGLLSIILVVVDSDAQFLQHGLGTQSFMQLFAMVATIAVAIVSGFFTCNFVTSNGFLTEAGDTEDYDDALWWIGID